MCAMLKQRESLLSVLSVLLSTPGSNTNGKDESHSVDGGNEWWKNFQRHHIFCRGHWSIILADLPPKPFLSQQRPVFAIARFQNHCLRATDSHTEGAGKILLSWVLKHCRDSFVSNHALAYQLYSCCKSFFFLNKGEINKYKLAAVCFSHE